MTRHERLAPAAPGTPLSGAATPIGAAAMPALHGPTGGTGAPSASTLITAPADKTSPRSFLDALGLSSPELREARRQETREQCIRAIKRGDVFGFPPALVRECQALMAEEDAGWALAEKSAYGMPGVAK